MDSGNKSIADLNVFSRLEVAVIGFLCIFWANSGAIMQLNMQLHPRVDPEKSRSSPPEVDHQKQVFSQETGLLVVTRSFQRRSSNS